jgi:hypothetical protein
LSVVVDTGLVGWVEALSKRTVGDIGRASACVALDDGIVVITGDVTLTAVGLLWQASKPKTVSTRPASKPDNLRECH